MSRRLAGTLVTGSALLIVVEVAVTLWFDHLERGLGRPDLVGFDATGWILLLGVISSGVVGSVIALSRPRNPVGWLFIALAHVVTLSGPIDAYADYGTLARPGSLPGAMAVAIVSDKLFISWVTSVALILFVTPDGRFLSPRWRWAGRTVVTSAILAMLLAFISRRPLNPPFQRLSSPWQVAALQPLVDDIRLGLVFVVHIGLIASAGSLLVRFRRSVGDERRRLLWLVMVVAAIPPLIVVVLVSAFLGATGLLVVATFGYVVLMPVMALLSVLRYRLYDVERIVAATMTWAMLTALLLGVYVTVVWAGARALPNGPVAPAISAAVGALIAASLFTPARQGIQSWLDRQFDQRAYDARRRVRAALAGQDAGIDLEQVFRQALRDESLTIDYPTGSGAWSTASGEPSPGRSSVVEVARDRRVVARVGFDPAQNDGHRVREVALLALIELDNDRLRAELSRRISEIAASRERLAQAQANERRRIERDLHDGAQQRLLALAFELQSALLNGDPTRMREALSGGAASAKAAVRDLRALANGLHPAALADGGLLAAIDEMGRHSPVPVRLHANTIERLDPGTEYTAWFFVGETVVNAQKHASAARIDVDVSQSMGRLRLVVRDDGHGGANPAGSGLRGLRDRIEAARGRMTITSSRSGTTVEAVLPCGS